MQGPSYVTANIKTQKEAQGTDWESIVSKYGGLAAKLADNLLNKGLEESEYDFFNLLSVVKRVGILLLMILKC